MKGIVNKLEKMYSAVAFAEGGEYETARSIMKEINSSKMKGSGPAERKAIGGIILAGAGK